MGYVALSRVRSLKHLTLDGLNGMALRVSPLAKQIDAELRAKSDQALHDHATHIKKWHEDEASGEHEKQMEEVQNQVLSPEAEQLFDALRDWRRQLATEKSLPPYIIAHDKTLKAVAIARPANKEELLKVDGFGSKKVETYGADILKVIRSKD